MGIFLIHKIIKREFAIKNNDKWANFVTRQCNILRICIRKNVKHIYRVNTTLEKHSSRHSTLVF